MISVQAALVLVGFGVFVALVCIVAGTVLHTRWIDRRLAPKKLPAPPVKPVP